MIWHGILKFMQSKDTVFFLWEVILQHFQYVDYNIVLNGKIIGVVNDEWERI
jgi:hypothetical protein